MSTVQLSTVQLSHCTIVPLYNCRATVLRVSCLIFPFSSNDFTHFSETMPENVPQQNDRPLEAPSLIELSAEIVANHAEHYLYTGKRDLSISERAAEAFLTASSSSKISDSREASPHGHSR